MRRAWPLVLVLTAASSVSAQTVERLTDGIAVPVGDRRLELRVCRDDIVRVAYAPKGAFFARETMTIVKGACQPTDFEVQTGDGVRRGHHAEADGARRAARAAPSRSWTATAARCSRRRPAAARPMTAATVMGESTFHVQAEFEPSAGEALYGLGAHQNGFMDYAGRDVDMYQLNTVDIVPFLASSRGYGLLWENTSHTKFGDLKPAVHIPAKNLDRRDGQAGRPHGHVSPGRLRRRAPSSARASIRSWRSARPRTGRPSSPRTRRRRPRTRRSTRAEGRRRLRGVGGRLRDARRPAPTTSSRSRPTASASGSTTSWRSTPTGRRGFPGTTSCATRYGAQGAAPGPHRVVARRTPRARCASSGRRRRAAPTRRCGPRSATASTTTSSTGRTSTTWSPATAS